MGEREYEVVVFGATSVTGRRVAAYVADRAAQGAGSWAPAARDPAKLERILGEEGIEAPASITADIGDPASLREMAARATTVVNLVGPYTRYGEPVIAACVEGGANYVDLTGEVPFVRRMIDRYHAPAREAGIKIVQVCGFEALPPDLGVLLAAETARERFGEGLNRVDLETFVTATPPGPPRPTDMVSGGTMQSMAEAAGDPDAPRLTDPALMIEDEATAAAVRAKSPIRLAPRRGMNGAVIAPMSPAAFINPAVIQRTAALLAEESGEPLHPFAYREGVAIGGSALTLPFRYAAAGALSGMQAGLAATARARESVRLRASSGMRRVFPSSGFGPRPERLEPWRWAMAIRGQTAGGNRVDVRIDAEGHPGYLATARLMGEAGLLISEPDATPERSGCLTPATALGTDRLDRFELARLRFSVS